MAPRPVSLLLALVGIAQAELAFKLEAANGMAWFQPSGVCKIALSDDGSSPVYEKFSCDSADAATVQTYASTDPECTGVVVNTAAVSLPHSVGGMKWSCEDVSSDGYLRVDAYNASDCNTASMCESQLFATGVCAAFSQPMSMGTFSASSTMVSQEGKRVMYPSNDCTGVGMVHAWSDTCIAEAANDDVCNGQKGFETFAATKTASVITPVTLPTSASMIIKFEPASGSMASHQPTGQCKPDFKEGTNIVESYSKWYCASASVSYNEKYLASDSACSGLMVSSAPMTMPIVHAGSGTFSCVDDTSDGFRTTRAFSGAGCGSGFCNLNRQSTGVCNVISTPMDLGVGTANSMKFTQALKTIYYASSDCQGDALFEEPKTAGCGATQDGETCNDGSAAYSHLEASSDPQPTTTPVSPTPASPTPASPTPASPTPASPTPTSPTPTSPTPTSPTPASPTPTSPTPASAGGADSSNTTAGGADSANTTAGGADSANTAAGGGNSTDTAATTAANTAATTAADTGVANNSFSQKRFMVIVAAVALWLGAAQLAL